MLPIIYYYKSIWMWLIDMVGQGIEISIWVL